LAEGFERSGHFDHGTCWLVRNAEERGELPRSLIVLEESCERSINWMRRWFVLFAGPVVVVAVAVVIGFIVVSLYLPIFTLGDVVSGH
jgi:type IV pilus assembly protein PilC